MNIHLTNLHKLHYAIMSLWIRILKQCFWIVWGGGIFDATYFPSRSLCAGVSVLTCVGPYEIHFFPKFCFFCFIFSGLLFNG